MKIDEDETSEKVDIDMNSKEVESVEEATEAKEEVKDDCSESYNKKNNLWLFGSSYYTERKIKEYSYYL